MRLWLLLIGLPFTLTILYQFRSKVVNAALLGTPSTAEIDR